MTKLLTGRLIEIRPGWMNAGRRGAAMAEPLNVRGQEWLAVLWFDTDDPEFHKLAGIRVVGEKDESFGLPKPWQEFLVSSTAKRKRK